eukprot:jgi/Psemu1/282445/fgenesh1_pg.7_\
MVRSISGSSRTRKDEQLIMSESSSDSVGLDPVNSSKSVREPRRTKGRSRSPGSLKTKSEQQRQRSRERDESYDPDLTEGPVPTKVKSESGNDSVGLDPVNSSKSAREPRRTKGRSRSPGSLKTKSEQQRQRSRERDESYDPDLTEGPVTTKVKSKAAIDGEGSESGEAPKSNRCRSKSRNRMLSRDDGSLDSKSRLRRVRPFPSESTLSRDRSKSPAIRRSRSRSRLASSDDDDNSSTSSLKSFRRTRRVDEDLMSDDNDDGNGSVSSTSSSVNRRRRTVPSQRRLNRKALIKQSAKSPRTSPVRTSPSLGNHLKNENQDTEEIQGLSMVDEVSTTSSSLSCSNEQPIFFQFDPTKETCVQTVDQTTAKKTSETIHLSDGTESKLEISEVSGLPTFEKPSRKDSMNNTESTRSMYSSDEESLEDGENLNKSTAFLSEESVPDSSNEGRQRGVLGNNLQAKTSAFLQRVQETKADVKDRLLKNPTINRAGIRLGRTAHQVFDDDDNDSIGDHQSLLP